MSRWQHWFPWHLYILVHTQTMGDEGGPHTPLHQNQLQLQNCVLKVWETPWDWGVPWDTPTLQPLMEPGFLMSQPSLGAPHSQDSLPPHFRFMVCRIGCQRDRGSRGPHRRAQSQMGPILQHGKVKSNRERVFEVRSGAVSQASKTPQQKWSYIITAALLKTSPASGLCLDLQLDPFVWQCRQSKTREAHHTVSPKTHARTHISISVHPSRNMQHVL